MPCWPPCGSRRQLATIPVIFVTAMNADENEQLGLDLGAVDYITKPIRPAILQARVRSQLELKRARDWLQDQNGYLEQEVQRRMRENELVRDVTLHALAMLAEARDSDTGYHIERTKSYVEALGRQLLRTDLYVEQLAGGRLEQMIRAAPLHDIGKVGIPDQILLKPGKLTRDEYEIMKDHARIGAEAIAESIRRASRARRAMTKMPAVRRSASCAWDRRSRARTTKNGTAAGTRSAWRERRSPCPRDSWPSPTCSMR